MKIFLSIFILIFVIHSLSKADNVNDFQIEGMSVGDSALNYFNKHDIDNQMKMDTAYLYPDKKYIKIMIPNKKKLFFDDLALVLKYSKKDYIIHEVSGRIYCDDINDCLEDQKQLLKDLKNKFKQAKLNKFTGPHYIDSTGDSIVYQADLLNIDGAAGASVYDWSDNLTKMNRWRDCVEVYVSSDEYDKYVRSITNSAQS